MATSGVRQREQVREEVAEGAVDAEVPFDAQELDFLKARTGPPAPRAELALLQKQVGQAVERVEADTGRAAHEIGTGLNQLYVGQADRVYGERSFVVWATRRFDLSRDDVRRYVRIASAFTAEQCNDLGATLLDAGAAIVAAKGWKDARPLFKARFTLPTGEVVGFPCTRAQARLILATLRRPPVPPVEHAVDLAEVVSDLNRKWRLRQTDNAVLASIGGRYQRNGEEVVFNAGSLTAEQRREYARFVLEVENKARR